MVEYDVNEYDYDMMDMIIKPQKTHLPTNAKYYPFPSKYINKVTLISTHNLLIDRPTNMLIKTLRNNLKMKHFDPLLIMCDNVLKLPKKLRDLIVKFMSSEVIYPIHVVEVQRIDDVSPTNPEKPNVIGIDTPIPLPIGLSNDYLYKPLGDGDKYVIAMSIFFGYTYIPCIVSYE